MVVSVVWGAVGLPLLLSLIMMSLLLATQPLLLKIRHSFYYSVFCLIWQFFTASIPALSFFASWVFFLGWPDPETFSGVDGLFLFLPVAIFLIIFSRYYSRRWNFGFQLVLLIWLLLGAYFFLRPLLPLKLSQWLVIFLLALSLSYWFWRGVFLYHRSDHLHPELSRNQIKKNINKSIWINIGFSLCVSGAGLMLAMSMLIWGSASWAQVMGGFLTSLAVASIFVAFNKLSAEFNLFEWSWVFLFWQSINAHFYLDIPIEYMSMPLLLLLVGGYWRQNPHSHAIKLKHVIILTISIFVVLIGHFSWSFLSKPKAFF